MSRHSHHNKSHHKKNDDKKEVINTDFFDCAEWKDDHSQNSKTNFTIAEALEIGDWLDINFEKCGFDLEQFRIGLEVELEHGRINPYTNITNDDPHLTGKITLAHLNEFPDYYKRLAKMEEEAEHYWKKRNL